MSTNRSYSPEMPARRTPWPSGSFMAALWPIVSTATMWQQRARDRAHLRDLEPHHLADVGIAPEQRDREVRKPFWVR